MTQITEDFLTKDTINFQRSSGKCFETNLHVKIQLRTNNCFRCEVKRRVGKWRGEGELVVGAPVGQYLL